MTTVERRDYARLYGPTTGDRIRLGDTDLWIEVEADDTEPGEELLGGCGKTARHGALVSSSANRASALDMIVLGVVLVDPLLGVRKTNIGIKDGRVVGVGRAGNPQVQAGVELEVDAHTAMITGEGLLCTPGVVDSHVHLSNADLAAAALSAGVTTLVGMGMGGVWDVGANPRRNLHTLVEGWADVPINAAFLARGSSTSAGLLEEAVAAGAGGFKIHEDWGATPSVIDTCLGVAEGADLPVALHTDTLNESGYLADTLDAVGGRTVHAYHVEGGGGHPDLLQIVSKANVLTSSTTPTLPLTPSTVAELGPMTLTVHRGHAHVPSDASIAASRIREHAISAENALHDSGAIAIVNSDALGMGRIGETARRTWQLAHVQATLAGETGPDVANNARVLRYLAKLTHNPAVAHGLAHHVGSVRPGMLADLVLWNPAWFGAQPDLVLKSGFVAWGAAGSGSGSTRLTQPRRMLPFYGGLGTAPARLAHVFVSEHADRGSLPAGRTYATVADSRGLTCADMLHNTATPHVEVAPEPIPVRVDGREVPLHRSPALPLTRLHHLG
ncbi:urease subunit alpha [Pseudonocardia kujensis]|uniref:urease subunit alpha n=1 Tax=Pseudonocardia kujensis TaxID=1128675 RepID=UPI001E361EE6|nr:urease subunit alpha [Pseudonocardia kujensis]MCE0762923.1 urease subunit alpha [Pseudonocardia kujensis]